MFKTLTISLLLAIGLIFSGYLIGNKPDIYNLETIKTESIELVTMSWIGVIHGSPACGIVVIRKKGSDGKIIPKCL